MDPLFIPCIIAVTVVALLIADCFHAFGRR